VERIESRSPDGLWYKDFGSFKICGGGKYPKTANVNPRVLAVRPMAAIGRLIGGNGSGLLPSEKNEQGTAA
jgi:hypothetical protein